MYRRRVAFSLLRWSDLPSISISRESLQFWTRLQPDPDRAARKACCVVKLAPEAICWRYQFGSCSIPSLGATTFRDHLLSPVPPSLIAPFATGLCSSLTRCFRCQQTQSKSQQRESVEPVFSCTANLPAKSTGEEEPRVEVDTLGTGLDGLSDRVDGVGTLGETFGEGSHF